MTLTLSPEVLSTYSLRTGSVAARVGRGGASRGPSIRVAFPLPNGRLTIFLRPRVRDDGALILASPLGSFGGAGKRVK